MAGANRTAVDHNRGPVEAGSRHQGAGHVLVAAGDRHAGIIKMGAHHGFNRIGDQVARLERVLHTRRTHRDAIADANRVEDQADKAGLDYPFFDLFGQVVQVHVTGVAFPAHAGNAHLRLAHILVGQADAIQHGLRANLRAFLGQLAAIFVQLTIHGCGCHPISPSRLLLFRF